MHTAPTVTTPVTLDPTPAWQWKSLPFTQDGAEFFNEHGKLIYRYRGKVPDKDIKAAELALKHFLIWCHDHRVDPVRL